MSQDIMWHHMTMTYVKVLMLSMSVFLWVSSLTPGVCHVLVQVCNKENDLVRRCLFALSFRYRLDLVGLVHTIGALKTMVSSQTLVDIFVCDDDNDDVISDYFVVTMAKGIGNGYPLGAIVTTPGM